MPSGMTALFCFWGCNMATDAFVPELKKITAAPIRPLPFKRDNLADDEELCKLVLAHLGEKYDTYSSDRKPLEQLWDSFDYMMKCGQHDTQRETERDRVDADSDDYMTRTKTRNIGSTIAARAVRLLASFLIDVLNSKPDVCRFTSRYNPVVPSSGEQADEEAAIRQAMIRYTRQAEGFDKKSVEFAYTLFTYGNVPVFAGWKQRREKIAVRKEVAPTMGAQLKAFFSREKPQAKSQVVEEEVLLENRPDFGMIPNEDFFADNNIPSIQRQHCMFTRSLAGWGELYNAQRQGQFLNVETLTAQNFYKGDTSGIEEKRQDNAGQESTMDDTKTGVFLQYQAFVELPIDESKPKGKSRWNEEKHIPQRYRVFVATKDNPRDGVCLRIARLDDPDNEWPIEMVSVYPYDAKRLYKVAPLQLIRGNYTAITTSKMQVIDRSTLDNNRPMKIKAGSVHVFRGGAEVTDLTFGPDTVYVCDNPQTDIQEFELGPLRDTMPILGYLEEDTKQLLGLVQIMTGVPMGQRTSANESQIAKTSAERPHMMDVRYIFHTWLCFYARKAVRYWNIFAEDDQILKIADSERILDVNPAGLHGDYDVEVTIADDYFHTIMEMDKWSYAARNVLPMFSSVLDLRKTAIYVCDRTLNWDVTAIVKPDNSEMSAEYARKMIAMMKQNQVPPIPPSMDLDALLRELQGERIMYSGAEEQNAWLIHLDRAIEQVEFMRQNQPAMMPMGSSPVPGPVQNPGAAAGNRIAAQLGAEAGEPAAMGGA